MTTRMYRQGDLLFVAIEKLPKKLAKSASNVIARGEATGHTHSLVEGRVLTDARSNLFLEVLRATQVVHQEHHAINLSPGYYQVVRQREYRPEGIREVWD